MFYLIKNYNKLIISSIKLRQKFYIHLITFIFSNNSINYVYFYDKNAFASNYIHVYACVTS